MLGRLKILRARAHVGSNPTVGTCSRAATARGSERSESKGMPLTDESGRVRATAFVLQRYHLSDLAEAEQKLTRTQLQGVPREIDEV